MLAKLFGENKDVALLLLRIVFGLIFIFYGWKHINNLTPIGTQGSYLGVMQTAGVPAPEIMGPFVAWLEFLGGIAALVGVFTRYAGALLVIVMAVSTITVKISPSMERASSLDPWGLTVGGGWNFDLLLLAVGGVLLLLGPGSIALERALFKREL